MDQGSSSEDEEKDVYSRNIQKAMVIEKYVCSEIYTTSFKDKQQLGLLFHTFTHKLFTEVLLYTHQWILNDERRNIPCDILSSVVETH